MGTQRGSFDPNQGKHDPILARNLNPGESVTAAGFGALMVPMMSPMKGKVYVTTKRVAVVLDTGRMWHAAWDDIRDVQVKKGFLASTAFVTTSGGEQWGVDSTKSIVRDVEAAWRIASAR